MEIRKVGKELRLEIACRCRLRLPIDARGALTGKIGAATLGQKVP